MAAGLVHHLQKADAIGIRGTTNRAQGKGAQLGHAQIGGASRCIKWLEDNTDRPYHHGEVAEANPDLDPETVRRTLFRLASTGKGSGPVECTTKGFYKFAPEKQKQISKPAPEVRYHNIWFLKRAKSVSQLGGGGSAVSQPIGTPTGPDHVIPGTLIGTPDVPNIQRDGFPMHLFNGAIVNWILHTNGTEIIWIAADDDPLHLDLLLHLIIDHLRPLGVAGSEWEQVSIELNIDGRREVVTPSSTTIQVASDQWLRAYNHRRLHREEFIDKVHRPIEDATIALLRIREQLDAHRLQRDMDKMKNEVRWLGPLRRQVVHHGREISELKKRRRRSK